MNNINFNKVFRIAGGSTLSYLICHMLGLEYSASAAVITLLSIQDTKKETVNDVIKRILSYFYAMLSAHILFTNIGYNEGAFFVFMLLLVSVSYILGWLNTLSSSTVVTTHFLLMKSFSPHAIYNEVMLLFIGSLCALILNVFFRDISAKIKRDCEIIELDISSLLKKTAFSIENNSEFDNDWLTFIFDKINKCCDNVISNSYNVEFEKSHYFNEYLSMRREQCHTIDRIHKNLSLCTLKNLPLRSDIIDIIYKISNNIHNKSSYKDDLISVKNIIIKFENQPLPATRAELFTYSKAADVLQELYFFVELNNKFVNHLTESEINSYWTT